MPLPVEEALQRLAGHTIQEIRNDGHELYIRFSEEHWLLAFALANGMMIVEVDGDEMDWGTTHKEMGNA